MAVHEDEVDGKVVLCGANSYDKKYFFNQKFNKIPDSMKEELHIICVLFTEEVGGIFTILFEEDGEISMRTEYAEEDYLYDEISSGLLIDKIRRTRTEMFEALSLFYRVFINGENLLGAEENNEDNEL